jgi:hypothetical protein
VKHYAELTEEQQKVARERALTDLLRDIIENGLRFNDAKNGDDLQARIDAAGVKSDEMQTPWFWSEYILDTCRDDLESIATATAEAALYPEAEEYTMAGIA